MESAFNSSFPRNIFVSVLSDKVHSVSATDYRLTSRIELSGQAMRDASYSQHVAPHGGMCTSLFMVF